MFKNSRGFTLIELVVVIAIIGILTTLVFSNLGSARVRSRDTKRKTDLKSIQNALESYYSDNNQYPAGTASLAPNYIPQVPVDPVGGGAYAYCAGSFTGVLFSTCTANVQGYGTKAVLENTSDPDISAGANLYIVCGGASGSVSGCAKP